MRTIILITALLLGVSCVVFNHAGVSGPFRVRTWTFNGPGGKYGLEQFGWYEEGRRHVARTVVKLGPFGSLDRYETVRATGVLISLIAAAGLPILFCSARKKEQNRDHARSAS